MKTIIIDSIEYLLTPLVAEEFWEPIDGEIAWYYDLAGIIDSSTNWRLSEINSGNMHKTKEEAEQAIELQLVTQRLKKAVWELGGREFVSNENNYAPYLEIDDNKIICGSWMSFKFYHNWFYLPTRDACVELIASHRNDLLTYLGR